MGANYALSGILWKSHCHNNTQIERLNLLFLYNYKLAVITRHFVGCLMWCQKLVQASTSYSIFVNIFALEMYRGDQRKRKRNREQPKVFHLKLCVDEDKFDNPLIYKIKVRRLCLSQVVPLPIFLMTRV